MHPLRLAVLIAWSSTIASAAPLRGNALVPRDVPLHPTAAAARDAASAPGSGEPVAMRVVREHAGGVVELTTAYTQDCVSAVPPPYEITVFVKRDLFVARTNVEVVVTNADGTAVAIDRGAPVVAGAWLTRDFAPAKVPPPDQLVLAVPEKLPSANLPTLVGDRMICDGGGRMTEAEWRAKHAATREADARAARKRHEERQAKCDAERALRKHERAQRKPKGIFESSGCAKDGSALSEFRIDVTPYCGVTRSGAIHSDHVVKVGTRYVAEIEYPCGRVRVPVDDKNLVVRSARTFDFTARESESGDVWVPAPGPVTWPDGKRAGTYSGLGSYRDVVEQSKRICVRVDGIAERVCHDKRKATRRAD